MRRVVFFGLWYAMASCDSTAPVSPPPISPPPPSASAPPSPSTPAAASASAAASTPAPDAARDQRIKERFGGHCRVERTCGGLWGVDCDAAVDGPYYYVKPDTLEVVSRCGGYCMGGRCTNCPPKEWSCATY